MYDRLGLEVSTLLPTSLPTFENFNECVLTSLATSDVSTHSLLSLHFLVFPSFPSRPFLPLDVALFKIQLWMDFGSTVNSPNGSGYTARLPKRICYFVHFFELFCEIYKEMEKAWASRLVLIVIGL